MASSNHWVADEIFLSAHCPDGGDCRWWSRDLFSYVGGKRFGAPRIWVAERKHANYYSAGKCNGGGFFGFDTCEFSNTSHRFPFVYTQQNVGSRATRLRDCVTPFWGSSIPNAQAVECMWDTSQKSRFDGWLGFSSGSPAVLYGNILAQYAGF